MTIHSVMALNAVVRRPRPGSPSTPPGPSSPWGNSIVAPRAAMRPSGKARRPRTGAPAARGLRGGVAIPGVFEGGATPPAPGPPTRQPRWGGVGMHRSSNAARLSPRAVRVRTLMNRHLFRRFPSTSVALALALIVLVAATIWRINVFELPGVNIIGIEQNEIGEIAIAFLLVIPAFFIDRAVARLRMHEAQLQAEQLRVLRVTMRTVQDIVNNNLNQLQLLR